MSGVVARVTAAIREAHHEVVFGESNEDAFRRLAIAALTALGPDCMSYGGCAAQGGCAGKCGYCIEADESSARGTCCCAAHANEESPS